MVVFASGVYCYGGGDGSVYIHGVLVCILMVVVMLVCTRILVVVAVMRTFTSVLVDGMYSHGGGRL